MSATPITELRESVAANPLWYHTMELAPGVVTSGWFDLRSVVERMPWPDVRGKRCLDVGTYDGFLAFELERREAAEVVATDLDDHARWDWPIGVRDLGTDYLASMAGPRKGIGFELARRALGSRVDRRSISVYDLSPERIGSFDVIVCGSLLLHLKDPIRALDAMRSVCRGVLLSAETVDLSLSLLRPRSPAAHFRGGDRMQWWIPNVAAHRRMLAAAGWRIERASAPYCIPVGPGHARATGGRYPRALVSRAAQRLLTGGVGVPHAAVLARL